MNIFSLDLIQLHYLALDKKSVLHEMTDFLEQNNVITDQNRFLKAIMERENLMSTGIGRKIAIPHACHPSVSEFKIAVYLLDNEIEFQAIDNDKVKLIFMICVPENQKKEYMRVLSAIANFIQQTENRSKLLSVSSKQEMLMLLKGIKYE